MLLSSIKTTLFEIKILDEFEESEFDKKPGDVKVGWEWNVKMILAAVAADAVVVVT